MLRTFIGMLFTPAIGLMGRLWYWQKFAVLTILFTIPVGFALFSYLTQIDKNIAFSEKEAVGMQYLSPTLAFLQDVQQHRGMASLYLRGDASFYPRLLGKEKKIAEDLALMRVEDQSFGKELGTTQALNDIQQRWALLEGNYVQLAPKESASRHTEFISYIIALIHTVGDSSNLILDPDLDSYYLMDTIVDTLPNLSENFGQARAFTLSIRDPMKISDAERRDIINYSKIARIADERMKRDLHTAFESNASLEAVLGQPLQETSVSVENFTSLLDTFADTSKIQMPLPAYYEFSTAAINTNFSLAQSLSVSLNATLQRRLDRLHADKQRSIAITAASYILILYVFIGFYLLVVRTVHAFRNIAEQLAAGKSINDAPVLSRDELGQVGESFNVIGLALVEKSQELQKKSDEFERMNQFMINREVKMSELKDEIARLKTEGVTVSAESKES